MAYSNGKSVLVANATPNSVTVGATTIAAGQVAKVTPKDAVAVKLGAEVKKEAITKITTTALAQAVQAESVIDFLVGTTKIQFVASKTAAAAATEIEVVEATSPVAIPNGTVGTTSSQGEVAGFIEAGCCVASIGAGDNDVVDAPVQSVEKGAHLLESMARAVVSAGADAWAAKGL
jgi:hypothetical protein